MVKFVDKVLLISHRNILVHNFFNQFYFQNRPVLIHFVEREQFTCVAWSIEQPNIGT